MLTTLDIVPAGPVDIELMHDLGQLTEELAAADLTVNRATAQVPGVKDGGLTVAISLAGLVVSSVSTAVSILTYWSSRKPRYTVTIEAGQATLQASALNKADVQALLSSLREEPNATGGVVRVSLR